MNKPRVLIIGPAYPNGGGVGVIDSILVTSDLNQDFEMLLLDTSRTKEGAGLESQFALINIVYYVRQFFKLCWILLTKRPVVLHQSVTDSLAFWKEISFILLGRIFGAKTIAHLHGPFFEKQLRNSSPFKKKLMIAALHVPHVIVALSQYWRELIFTYASPHLNVVVAANCVDRSIEAAMQRVEGRSTGGDVFNVLYLGWLCERKGLPDALQALPIVRRQAPQARFVFAGMVEAGPAEEKIRQLCKAAEKEGGAIFPGLVMEEEKIRLLVEASVLILPSYNENLPISIIEAMAMGLPVISTPVGGVPELIADGENGYLVSPGDTQALADRLIRLAQDPQLRRSMGKKNYLRASREFTPTRFAERFHDLYDDLLKKGHR